jgi:hypothetical protein
MLSTSYSYIRIYVVMYESQDEKRERLQSRKDGMQESSVSSLLTTVLYLDNYCED